MTMLLLTDSNVVQASDYPGIPPFPQSKSKHTVHTEEGSLYFLILHMKDFFICMGDRIWNPYSFHLKKKKIGGSCLAF